MKIFNMVLKIIIGIIEFLQKLFIYVTKVKVNY